MVLIVAHHARLFVLLPASPLSFHPLHARPAKSHRIMSFADPCQFRLKIPHSAVRKFPSPGEVVVYSFDRRMEYKIRPVKRRRAMQECNPPRNSWLQTHQDDEPRGGARDGLALGSKRTTHRIDRFAHALKTQSARLPRLLGA